MNEPGNPYASVPHNEEDTMSEVQEKEAITPDTLAKKIAATHILWSQLSW